MLAREKTNSKRWVQLYMVMCKELDGVEPTGWRNVTLDLRYTSDRAAWQYTDSRHKRERKLWRKKWFQGYERKLSVEAWEIVKRVNDIVNSPMRRAAAIIKERENNDKAGKAGDNASVAGSVCASGA